MTGLLLVAGITLDYIKSILYDDSNGIYVPGVNNFLTALLPFFLYLWHSYHHGSQGKKHREQNGQTVL
jgi:hypothetical protein